MSCKLFKGIKASSCYNPGGIGEIFLLDMDDFMGYRFRDDSYFSNSFVEAIFRPYEASYLCLEAIRESSFSETKEATGVYKQSLSTFVHTLEAEKLESLLLAVVRRYVVVFKSLQGSWFTFGSEGGASVGFSQISGQSGEANGYSVSISANSVYPLFEASADVLSFKFDSVYRPEYVCELVPFSF